MCMNHNGFHPIAMITDYQRILPIFATQTVAINGKSKSKTHWNQLAIEINTLKEMIQSTILVRILYN